MSVEKFSDLSILFLLISKTYCAVDVSGANRQNVKPV